MGRLRGIFSGASRGFWGDTDAKDVGAAMVELAFVLILLVMLLVGTVTAAVSYGRSNSIQNAAREASRFGATLPDVENNLADVIGVAEAAASGDLDASVPGRVICVAFIDEANDEKSLTDVGGTQTPGTDPCFPDDRPDEAKVQVSVARDSDFEAIVYSTTITLSSSAAARYER